MEILPLDQELREKKNSLRELEKISFRVLQYLPNVLSGLKKKMAIAYILR